MNARLWFTPNSRYFLTACLVVQVLRPEEKISSCLSLPKLLTRHLEKWGRLVEPYSGFGVPVPVDYKPQEKMTNCADLPE
jgi:hypothetical protein